MRKIAAFITLLALVLSSVQALAFEPDKTNKKELEVKRAILDILIEDPGIQKFFDDSAGYAVFPKVGKGGIIVGGAFGRGLVISNEQVDGYTALSQATIGLQLGGQSYAQFIFFKDETALDHFKRGNFEFSAQASAVAITLGASADANYDAGVAVFTHINGGLMFEGSIGGQRFSYKPKIPE